MAENTHFIRRGTQRTGDLLFDWLASSCFAYVELDTNLQVWLNPNKSNKPYSDSSTNEVRECSLPLVKLFIQGWWTQFVGTNIGQIIRYIISYIY